MSTVMVEITPQPPIQDEPQDVILLSDLETLTEGALPGCNDDNPYR
ncbi:hypothetical protein ACIQOU_25365 [Streptomyces sp. NPDC091279]